MIFSVVTNPVLATPSAVSEARELIDKDLSEYPVINNVGTRFGATDFDSSVGQFRHRVKTFSRVLRSPDLHRAFLVPDID